MIFASFLDAILDPATILMTLLMFFGILLIIIILLQKGRGGGLAGAFGGAGGQSALGTKAGDVFTKITIVMAVIWVILSGVSGIVTRASSGKYSGGSAVTPEDPSIEATGKDEDAKMPEAEPGKADFNPPAQQPAEKPADAGSTPAKTPEKEPAKTEPEAKPAEPSKPEESKPAPEKKPEAPAKTEKPASEPKSE